MEGNTHVSLSAISNNSDGPKEEEKQDAHQKKKFKKLPLKKKICSHRIKILWEAE